jgi:hypothetical protein
VRHNPNFRGSDTVANLVSQHSKDLFSLSNGLGSTLRQVSRKFSQRTRDGTRTGVSSSALGSASTVESDRYSSYVAKKPQIIHVRADGARQSSSFSNSGRYTAIKHRRGLKRRLSNLGWLLARSSHAQTRSQSRKESNILHDKRQVGSKSTFGLGSIHSESKNLTTSEGIMLGTQTEQKQRSLFKRRMRAKISKWVRDTKAAVKHCGSKYGHGVEAA